MPKAEPERRRQFARKLYSLERRRFPIRRQWNTVAADVERETGVEIPYDWFRVAVSKGIQDIGWGNRPRIEALARYYKIEPDDFWEPAAAEKPKLGDKAKEIAEMIYDLCGEYGLKYDAFNAMVLAYYNERVSKAATADEDA